jgi:hypothetical protein
VLYVANAVLDAIERVPLIPPTLKLVGFGFSTWFFFRCGHSVKVALWAYSAVSMCT